MASIRGGNKKNGKLGDFVYYELDGTQVVRTIGKVSKKRYLYDEAFDLMRRNMSEFGTASVIGKVFRQLAAPFDKLCGDRYISGRVNKEFKKIISSGCGEKGKRAFEISKHGQFFTGFEFNKKRVFSYLFRANFSLTLDSATGTVHWNIPPFDPRQFVSVPVGSSHFKLVLLCVAMSDYVFDSDTQGYVPVLPAGIASTLAESDLISLDCVQQFDMSCAVGSRDVHQGIVVCCGILFYQRVNGDDYLLANNAAMQVLRVF